MAQDATKVIANFLLASMTSTKELFMVSCTGSVKQNWEEAEVLRFNPWCPVIWPAGLPMGPLGAPCECDPAC